MKTSPFVFFGIACLLPGLLCAENPPPVPPATPDPQVKDLVATLVPEKNVILPGEPLYFEVTVKNNSQTNTAIYRDRSFLTTSKTENRFLFSGGFEYGPAPTIPPGKEYVERLLLSQSPGQPGEYTITSYSEFVPFGGDENPNHKIPVTATAKITVLPEDKERMGVLIERLGERVMSIVGSPDNSEQQDALSKLEAIDDERAIPWLVKFQQKQWFNKNYHEPGLDKFDKKVVQTALKEYATGVSANAPYFDPGRSPIPKIKDGPLNKAFVSGDAHLVRQLVLQGADIRSLAKSDAMAEKYWTAPLDENTVSPEISIQVPPQIKKGEPASIHIEFKNTGDVTCFYNPDMKTGYYMPAGLLLFDSDRKCVCDLFESAKGLTLNGVGDSNPGWMEKGDVRKIDKFFGIFKSDGQDDVFYPGITTDEKWNRGIVPGHYYLQVVYWLRFIAPLPDTPGTAEEKVLSKTKGRNDRETAEMKAYERDRYYKNPVWKLPLYRSNIVPVEITE